MTRWFIGIALLVLLPLAGCNVGEVSQGEMEEVRKEMSYETYEEAMKKAGRGDELERDKAEAARRREADGEDRS